MTDGDSRSRTRASIVESAARLLHEQGADAVTTRAVAQAAGMQAPTIYRFFEDKDALLDAVAEHVLATYVNGKTVTDTDDPVADLRSGWDAHIDFGLANAALFGLLVNPARGGSPAAESGLAVLSARVRRVAAAGRLRIPERRAVDLIHAAGTGTILALLATPPQHRDPALSATMYDTVARTVLTDAPTLPAADATAAAVAFRAVAPQLPGLSDAERTLLNEWLDRAASTT